MVARFQERAAGRSAPGASRRWRATTASGSSQRMQLDYMDYAMLGDATGGLEDGVLVLRIDLRPKPEG